MRSPCGKQHLVLLSGGCENDGHTGNTVLSLAQLTCYLRGVRGVGGNLKRNPFKQNVPGLYQVAYYLELYHVFYGYILFCSNFCFGPFAISESILTQPLALIAGPQTHKTVTSFQIQIHLPDYME